MQGNRHLGLFVVASLAVSLTLGALPAFAGPGDLNSTNDGRDVQGGTYFNTEGSRTTFVNTGAGGLWVRSGVLVRGLESDANKVPTGNGGTMYFSAPGNVIRIDGDIDASAVKSGSLYLGNGGKVFMDSAYLFQSGNIFANGFNGGLVQFNVGAATLAPGAKITAQGFGGNGGSVVINSPGTVDIQNAAIIDTSGKVIGTFDTNVINIEGGLVNNEGIIRANGVAAVDFNPSPNDAAIVAANPQLLNNPNPGTISGGTGQGVIMGAPQPHQVPGDPAARGGTIRLVASGQTYDVDPVIADANTEVISSGQKITLLNRQASLKNNSGSVVNFKDLFANGAAGQDGGSIILAAQNDVFNFGTIQANGGNGVRTATNGTDGGDGGTIAIAAMDRVVNHGIIQVNGGNGGNAADSNLNSGNNGPDTVTATGVAGTGGKGGAIAVSYNTMENPGKIFADGGAGGFGANANIFHSVVATQPGQNVHANATAIAGDGGTGGRGGLIVLSGPGNPTGGGILQANGGRGGRGGNAVADARATAQDTGGGQATVNTNPVRGQGGQGAPTGTVVAPNPGNLPFDQMYLAQAGGLGNSGSQWHLRVTRQNGVTTVNNSFEGGSPGSRTTGPHNTIVQTRRNELVVNAENAILMSRAGGTGTTSTTLTGRINDATLRTVDNPLGVTTGQQQAIRHHSNLMVASTTPNTLLRNDMPNSNIDPFFTNLSTLTFINNGDIDNDMHWSPGVNLVGPGFHDFTFALGGGHLSAISSGNIVNDGFLLARGLWSGGTVNLAANGNITNNGTIYSIAFNPHTSSGFTREPGYISSHSGGAVLKAGGDIVNNRFINHKEAFFDIHPGLDSNPRREWVRFMNAGQIGHSNYLLAGDQIINNAAGRISSESFTYRDGSVDDGANHPANAMGGIMTLKAANGVVNNGELTVDAQSWFGTSGNFKFNNFSGLTQVNSTDGVIIIE